MTDHELPLVAFLAGDLEPTTARAVDEHLLSCDQCWLAAREDRAGRALAGLLREPTDPGLADRIRLAVDQAPVPEHGRRVHSTRAHTGVSAAATAVIALVLTAIAIGPLHRVPARDSPALRQVVALARQLPPADGGRGVAGAVALDEPHTVRAGDAGISVQAYAFGGEIALLASSSQPFTMPRDARRPNGRSMRWTVTRGSVTVYCPVPEVLLAGREPAKKLAALARVLHLA